MVNYPQYGETQIRNVVVITTLLTRIRENNDNEQTIPTTIRLHRPVGVDRRPRRHFR